MADKFYEVSVKVGSTFQNGFSPSSHFMRFTQLPKVLVVFSAYRTLFSWKCDKISSCIFTELCMCSWIGSIQRATCLDNDGDIKWTVLGDNLAVAGTWHFIAVLIQGRHTEHFLLFAGIVTVSAVQSLVFSTYLVFRQQYFSNLWEMEESLQHFEEERSWVDQHTALMQLNHSCKECLCRLASNVFVRETNSNLDTNEGSLMQRCTSPAWCRLPSRHYIDQQMM